MKKALVGALWLVGSLVIVAAFLWAPAASKFVGQSSRILFFHVPMAWVSFVAFFAAGIWSVRYLYAGRRIQHDLAAKAAIDLGLVFCLLATITGAMWATTEWGTPWNWDPRQTSITVALVFYAAYAALRQSLSDAEAQRRLCAVWAALGLAVAPFLFFIAPRMVAENESLHPQPVVNASGNLDMEMRIGIVLTVSSLTFTALFFWMHNLYRRLLALSEESA